MIFSPIIPIWILILLFVISLVFFGGKNIKKILLVVAIFALLFLINLRFKSVDNNAKVSSSNLDIMFVIDTSISMAAEDFNGNERRLDALMEDCDTIVSELSGSKYGLIVFSNEARIVVPYTSDSNIVKSYLKSISIPIVMYAKGTDINTPLDLMYDTISNYKSKDGRKKVLFFISDGEITNGESLKSFSKMKGLVDYAAVLGYGTSQGGYMKAFEYQYASKEMEYVQDRSQGYPYKKAVSKIDENNLKKIARDMGADYVHVTSHSDISSVIENAKKEMIFEDTEEMTESYSDTYYYYAIPLLIILAVLFIRVKSKI